MIPGILTMIIVSQSKYRTVLIPNSISGWWLTPYISPVIYTYYLTQIYNCVNPITGDISG